MSQTDVNDTVPKRPNALVIEDVDKGEKDLEDSVHSVDLDKLDENFEDPEIAVEMIDWIEQTLEANPDKYWITQTHVFFGNNWYESLEVLWNATYTNKLM